MTPSEVKNAKAIAQKMIKSGQNKQSVYEHLVGEYKEHKTIADIVRFIPSPQKLKKYGIWNTLYFVFISVVFVFSFTKVFNLSLFWIVGLVGIVAFKQFKYYYWNMFFGIMLLLIGSFAGIYFFY